MARFHRTIRKLWPASKAKKIAVLLVLILLACSGGFFAISEQTGFCNSCHIMNPYYASWQQSKHSEVNCLECHVQPGLAGLAKAKLNGLAQAVDYFLDRDGPKPNALVEDASCLRDGCHVKESLSSESLTDANRKYKFSHQAHVFTELVGIRLRCTTCHSHFEGQEHFKVSTQACLICHLQKAGTTAAWLMQTKCLDCHDVPAESIIRGGAEIDHPKFVASQLSCEQLCHNRQIDPQMPVRDVRCLDCHEFRNQGEYDAIDLHAMHHGKNKVECLACHEIIRHTTPPIDKHHTSLKCEQCHSVLFEAAKLAEIESIDLPTDCSLCHNDPHLGQFTKACQTCHSEHGWNGRWVVDVHSQEGAFALAGRHRELECARCHRGPKLAQARFVGLPRTCEQCHPDPHEGQMSMSCDKCHDERGFKAPWVKEHHHEESVFALQGKHTSLQCRQCHNKQLKAQELVRTETAEIELHCQSCHQDPHQNQMGASCQTCHSESGWAGSNLLFSHDQQASFKLEGPHAALACDTCHGRDEKRYRPLPHDCGDCHQKQTLAMQGIARMLSRPPDPHNDRLSCTDCHDLNTPRQRYEEFAARCATCHNSRYGALFYFWANALNHSSTLIKQNLKRIDDPNDARRLQLGPILEDAATVGFHNLNLTQEILRAGATAHPENVK